MEKKGKVYIQVDKEDENGVKLMDLLPLIMNIMLDNLIQRSKLMHMT